MKKIVFSALVLVLGLLFVVNCSTVPITGRSQLTLFSAKKMNAMALSSYSEFMSNSEVVSAGENAAMVKRIGANISKAVEEYLVKNGYEKMIQDFNWEFSLVKDPSVNAWCMPGGRVVVYEGLLPVTKTENALAVVIGHEIAHAVANHGSERMSQQMTAQIAQMGLAIGMEAFMQEKPDETKAILAQAFGMGSTLGVLAYSRKHEYEADKLGLIFMAMAGYDPRPASAFWERMSQMSGGQKPPEFMSTHPSDEKRIAYINEIMPEVMTYYTGKK